MLFTEVKINFITNYDLYIIVYLLNMFLRIFKFFNEKILHKSKESTYNTLILFNILKANIRHSRNTKKQIPLKLQTTNDVLKFPLPNRYSNLLDVKGSKPQLFMVIKQAIIASLTVDKKLIDEVQATADNANGLWKDPSAAAVGSFGLNSPLHSDQFQQAIRIGSLYGPNGSQQYNLERELFFADGIVNGEQSYILRKYGHKQYQLGQTSKTIEKEYQRQFQRAIKQEIWNKQNLQKSGLTSQQILRRVKEKDGIYCFLFQDFQNLSKGQPIIHNPNIYIENQKITDKYYLQVPYPIFLRIKKNQQYEHICIAIGFRSKGKVNFYSPFFASQGQNVWRLAQSHLLQVVQCDFQVRLHLGIYHFSTNQYHVPIYKYRDNLQINQQFQRFNHFLQSTYTMFSKGLEGINVAANITLVNPVPQLSVLNSHYNMSQKNMSALIAAYANRIKIYQFNPLHLIEKNGLNEEEIAQYFDKTAFDIELYKILSKYVKEVYQIFQINDFGKGLMEIINKETQNMGVGQNGKHRPKLENQEHVLKTIQNLIFCWSGFHAHSFAPISLSTYWNYRPCALTIPITSDESQWKDLKIGAQFPNLKLIMESNKVRTTTTQRNPDNYLLDNMQKQVIRAAYQANRCANNSDQAQSWLKLQKAAQNAVDELKVYEKKILSKNEERRAKGGRAIVFDWMPPSRVQTSVNI